MSVLEFALAYRRLGLSVIPVSSSGKRKAPHAAALSEVHGSSSWKRFRETPATAAEIRAWYEAAPEAGVAILTGCVGDVLVADFDGRVSLPSLPVTPIVKTRRGYHVYLRGQARKKKTHFGDLLGSGAYAVAPPSLHAEGAYEWQIAPPGLGTLVLPEEDFLNLDEAPYLLADSFEASSWGAAAPSLPNDTHYTCEVGVTPLPGDETSEEFARRALDQIGIKYSSLTRIRCPLHPDGRPSAGLFRGNSDGGWVFKCHACDQVLTLGQLYAKKHKASLNPPTVRKWWDRLLFETGPLELPGLPALDIPQADGARKSFIDGFLLLYRIDAYGDGVDPRALRGVPYTASFGTPWTGISESSFLRARGHLINTGWLQQTGAIWTPRKTALWQPHQWHRKGDA